MLANERFTDEDIRGFILRAASEAEWFTTNDVLRAAGFDGRHRSHTKNPVSRGLYPQRIYSVLRKEFNYCRAGTTRAVYKITEGA